LANLRRLLWFLLGGTRGGPLRIRILQAVRERPRNANELATDLGVDYKTARHHLKVLVENRVLSPVGQGYGVVFLPTADMEASWVDFDELAAKIVAKDEAREMTRKNVRNAREDSTGDSP
jgi:DNA-binding transcriptional ArsR family regulator